MIHGIDELCDHPHTHPSSSSSPSSSYDEEGDIKYHVSLAFIERIYIIFWISKDFFWSVGTGEVFNYRPLAPMWEGLAMIMGCSAIFVYVAACYVYRRDFMQLLDNVSTIMWICANFVWMCGKNQSYATIHAMLYMLLGSFSVL